MIGLDDACTWPRARLGEALSRADAFLGAAESARVVANPAPDVSAGASVERWLEAGARRLGLALSPVDDRACGLAEVLTRAEGKQLLIGLWTRPDGEVRHLLVVGPVRSGDASVRLLTPSGPREVAVDAVERALFREPAGDPLAALALPGKRVVAARRALRSSVGGGLVSEGWLLNVAPVGWWARARRAGVVRALAGGMVGFAAQLALFATGWAIVGRGALEGRLEAGTLAAFGLLLATAVVVRARASLALSRAIVLGSALVRERLLQGILGLDASEVRSRGVGQWLGVVLEVDSLELLARAGGPAVVWAAFDIGLGAWLLAVGASGPLELALLVLFLVVLALGVRRIHRRLTAWTTARLRATHELVESMVGHRTLVAQDEGQRHTTELRQGIERYLGESEALDDTAAKLTGMLPRAWTVLALLGLLPAFVQLGGGTGALATALGGVLVVGTALRRLAEASPAVAAAAVAYENLRGLLRAGARARKGSADVLAATPDEAAVGRRGLVVARDVTFQYAGRPEAVLKGCSFSVRRGDRILLEGGSGGGKSTLGALLSGLRQPTSGVLLLGGFDHHAVGPERWRQRAAGVPQFHDNHVFAASMLFNLLLGRRWPPRLEDVTAAEAVCRELGLGPLLERMPAGLNQTVGDSGWQLSHGERSRLFVARSLLQRVDVRVFDESLAALDPETSVRVIESLLRRPEALVLIAHR